MVDAQTRDDLEDLVLQVHKDYGVTILFVTHDIDESVTSRIGSSSDARADRGEGGRARRARGTADQIETKGLPEFAQLRTHVYRLIKREQVADEERVPELVEPSLGEAGTASRSGG